MMTGPITTDRIDRMVLKFRDVLAETERLGPEKLRAYQENLLGPLIQHAHRNVPFYKNRLASLLRDGEVDLARWREVPILTRAEAQRSTKAMTATISPPYAGPVESGETSGATGRPLHYLCNEITNVAALALTDRAFRHWNFDGGKSMALFTSDYRHLAPPPDGATFDGWRPGFRGKYYLLGAWADTDAQIEWLCRRRPNYLTAQSGTLFWLAERVLARGVDLKFEGIVSIAMTLTDEIRALCREAFGARIADRYGASEIGSIASECPYCGHYHIDAEAVVIEVVRDDGMACEPGETGRVIATSLYNYAMPFIRYEIGDYAMAGPARIKCPVKLPALSRIFGRYRNMFTLADGRIIYPDLEASNLREFISFEQMQVVQTEYDQVEVRYVSSCEKREPDETGLEAYVRARLDPSLHVSAVAVDEIPRAASGKFEDYLSLVTQKRN
jgi:phenylacetate-CoA ligase